MKKFFLPILLICLGVVANAQIDTNVVNLNEVIISATRSGLQLKDIPQKVEIITAEEIKGIPSENIAEVLKRTTNLDIIQYPGLSASVGMRGFAPTTMGSNAYVLILINGKPAGTQNLASIDMNNVEKIEVVKGPYSSAYGSQAMGGVINIITKKNSDDISGSVSYSSGSYNSSALSANASLPLSKKVNVGINFSKKQQLNDYRIGSSNLLSMSEKEEYILDKNSYGDIMKNSAWELNNINGVVDYKINSKWSANSDIIYTYANDVETPGNYWGSYGYSKKDISRLNIYENIKRVSDNNIFQFSPFYTTETNPNYSDISDTAFIDFKSKLSEYGFMLQDNYSLGNFNITGGADYKVSDYQSERQSNKGVYAKPYRPNNYVANSAVFAQIGYTKKSFSANAGLRYDYYNFHTDKNDSIQSSGGNEIYNTVNPSLGLQYRFMKKFRAHTSAGTGFLVPDAYKIAGQYKGWYTYVGNPELKPEKSTTYDAGVSFNSSKYGVELDVTYFNTLYTDKIISTKLETGERSYDNAQEANMDGIELNASLDFGALADNKYKLKLYANFTYMINSKYNETVISSTGIDSTLTKDLIYVRKSNGNFGLMFNNNNGFVIRVNGRYIGSRLENDYLSSLRPDITEDDYYTNGDYTANNKILQHPNFLIFDLYSAYTFKNNFGIGISVNNIFDENYTEKDGYNMPGRMISGKISYSF